MRVLALVVALLSMSALSCQTAAAELTSQQAASHVGETATVCGTLASANYATRTKGQPTFMPGPSSNIAATTSRKNARRRQFGQASMTTPASLHGSGALNSGRISPIMLIGP